MSWRLVDGEQRAKEHPDSFEMPPRELRERLDARGPDRTLAKLIFEPEGPCKVGGERMWVLVGGRGEKQRYTGRLNNNPQFIQGLHSGQRLEFGPEHVVDVGLVNVFALRKEVLAGEVRMREGERVIIVSARGHERLVQSVKHCQELGLRRHG